MPPVAAAASAIASGIGAAASAVAGAVAAAGTGTALAVGTTAVGAYQQYKQAGEAEKAKKKQEAIAAQEQAFAEKQAGEYFELTRRQMEMQSHQSQINTLAELIARANKTPEPRVLTLPPAKTYDVVTQINMAIDKLFRG